MGGIVSYNYEALKDFAKWNGLKPLKKSVPLLDNLLRVMINQLNSKKK